MTKSPRKFVAAVGEGSRLSDIAYTRVLELLFERRLPVGSFVSQSQLVELTGVQVAPLRDALRVLDAEGVLTIHPRSGIQFVKPGIELTRSTYQFRSIIECMAIKSFTETASDEEIGEVERRHLNGIKQLEREGLSAHMLAELEALENLLHGSIVASLSNPLITSSYRRIRNYIRLVRLERRLTTPIAMRSLREHITIIEACGRRNPTDAVIALEMHFSGALQRSLRL